MAELTFPQPKEGGFFHKPAKEQQPALEEFSDIARRMRLIEEKYTNLRRKTQLTDQNMLEQNKRISAEIKTIDSDIVELKREIFDIKNKMMLVIKELQDCAKKEQISILKKYMDLWNPANFVTQNEIEKIVGEIIDKK